MTGEHEAKPPIPEVSKSSHPSTLPLRSQLAALLSLSRARTKPEYRRLASLSALLTQQELLGKQWDAADTVELEALLTQYTSLREESMNTINNRVQVMMLGMAAMGALVAGVLTIDDPVASKLPIFAIFSIAIPLVAIFVLLVWISEAVRCHRVGYFLAADCEARINAKLGRLVMTWEASLWAGSLPRDELFGPSMMAMFVVGLLSCLAPFFGLLLTQTPINFATLISPSIFLPYGFFAMAIAYVLANMSRLKNKDVILSTLIPDAKE